MTVISYEDIEYSGIIGDVIKTLSKLDNYILRIWVDGTEIPYRVFDEDTIEFLHESIKITDAESKSITWILYGIIMSFKVVTNVTP